MKICLDAGHSGKYNRSPANPAYYESVAMWRLTELQKKHLEARGVEVVTTRERLDDAVGLSARGKAAAGCDLFISNHSNAVAGGGVDDKTDYVVAFTHPRAAGGAVAEKLAHRIAAEMGTSQRAQTKANGALGVLNGAASVGVPAILLEHSFHTNTRATGWLLDDGNLDALAKAEAEAIAEYYGLEPVAGTGGDAPAKPDASERAPSAWAAVAWEWAKAAGVCDGTRPGDALTREESVTMLHRLSLGRPCKCYNK